MNSQYHNSCTTTVMLHTTRPGKTPHNHTLPRTAIDTLKPRRNKLTSTGARAGPWQASNIDISLCFPLRVQVQRTRESLFCDVSNKIRFGPKLLEFHSRSVGILTGTQPFLNLALNHDAPLQTTTTSPTPLGDVLNTIDSNEDTYLREAFSETSFAVSLVPASGEGARNAVQLCHSLYCSWSFAGSTSNAISIWYQYYRAARCSFACIIPAVIVQVEHYSLLHTIIYLFYCSLSECGTTVLCRTAVRTVDSSVPVGSRHLHCRRMWRCGTRYTLHAWTNTI